MPAAFFGLFGPFSNEHFGPPLAPWRAAEVTTLTDLQVWTRYGAGFNTSLDSP